jgi:hypothetical protein
MGLMQDVTGIPQERWDAEEVRHRLDFDQILCVVAVNNNCDDVEDHSALLYNRQYAALVCAMRARKVVGIGQELAKSCFKLAWEIDVWSLSQNPSTHDRPKTWEEFLTPEHIELAISIMEN